MRGKNWNLIKAIHDAGMTHKEVAKRSGVNRTYLSLAVNEKYNLNDQQKAAVANTVGKAVKEIFD